MNTQDEISKARQAKERASEKLRNAANMLYGTPAWNTPKCKQYLDELFDTEAIYLARLEYLEHDDDECEHPESERWPFKDGMEVCALCGAIIHPVEVPF